MLSRDAYDHNVTYIQHIVFTCEKLNEKDFQGWKHTVKAEAQTSPEAVTFCDSFCGLIK